jgi:hypothetical protein
MILEDKKNSYFYFGKGSLMQAILIWLKESQTWVFSGIGVFGIAWVFFWLRKFFANEKIDSPENIQHSGDHGTSIQAKEIHMVGGITYSDAKEIAEDVFKNNFVQLRDEAKAVAEERASEITSKLLVKLKDKDGDSFHNFKDPGLQSALFDAQKEYAKVGDEDLADVLVDILVDRAALNERNLMQIVLNESLQTAPKLTPPLFDILSVTFILKHTRNSKLGSLEDLGKYLENSLDPFLPNLTKELPSFQHLESTGCGSVSALGKSLGDIFRTNYAGLFSKGFSKDKIESLNFSLEEKKQIFIPCLNDPELLQVNALDKESDVKDLENKLNLKTEAIDALKKTIQEHLMTAEKALELVEKVYPNFKILMGFWKESQLSNFSLTTVGIAIAHANIRRKIKDEYDLSIWIK